MEEHIEPESVTFYIDADFRCYTEPANGRREMQSPFFVGRETDIPFYRYVPGQESWTDEDGAVFIGEMVTPIRN